MNHRLSNLAALLAGMALCAAAHAQPREWQVSGRFVDPTGQPLAGAELARYFLSTKGELFAHEPLRGDEAGAFAGTINPYKLPMVYLAYDKQRTLGARVTLTEESITQPLTITLRPLAEVTYESHIENGYEPSNFMASIGIGDPATVVLLSYDVGPYKIPAGEYDLRFGGQEILAFRKPFALKEGESLDLGVCNLALTPIARNVGKPAMEIEFAEARGVDPDFRIEDLRGKWVLIEFWGFW